jgi:hypothetical protein
MWGDRAGMARLLANLSALRDSERDDFRIDGPKETLTVRVSDEAEGSTLQKREAGFVWDCSRKAIALATDLVEPLLHGVGHQFFEVDGFAEQIVVARDEYPADFR